MLLDILRNIKLVLLTLVDKLGNLNDVDSTLQKSIELLDPSLEFLGLTIAQTFQMLGDLVLHLSIGYADWVVTAIAVVVQVVWKHHEEPRFYEVVVHVVEEVQCQRVHSIARGVA